MRRYYFKGVFFITMAALFWSSAGLLIKWTTLPALSVAMYRSLWAGGFLLVYFMIIKRRHAGRIRYRIRWRDFGTAFFYMLTVTLFVAANKWTTAANAVFLQYTAPVYVIAITYLFLKEKVYPAEIITVILCLTGMALFFMEEEKSTALWGNLLGVAAGVVFALLQIFVKKTKVSSDGSPDVQTQNIQSTYHLAIGNGLTVLVTALLLTGTGFFNAGADVSLTEAVFRGFTMTADDAVVLFALGIGQLGLGYVCFAKGVPYLSSVEISIYTLLEPICNPIWAYIGIGEQPGPWAIGGGGLILTALIFNAWLNRQRNECL